MCLFCNLLQLKHRHKAINESFSLTPSALSRHDTAASRRQSAYCFHFVINTLPEFRWNLICVMQNFPKRSTTQTVNWTSFCSGSADAARNFVAPGFPQIPTPVRTNQLRSSGEVCAPFVGDAGRQGLTPKQKQKNVRSRFLSGTSIVRLPGHFAHNSPPISFHFSGVFFEETTFWVQRGHEEPRISQNHASCGNKGASKPQHQQQNLGLVTSHRWTPHNDISRKHGTLAVVSPAPKGRTGNNETTYQYFLKQQLKISHWNPLIQVASIALQWHMANYIHPQYHN